MTIKLTLISLILIFSFAQSVDAESAPSPIRKIDFKQFLIKRNHLVESEICPIPIKRIEVQYVKLLQDGSEQAIVEAVTCAMGNGGADIVEVFQLNDRGIPISLVIDDSGYTRDFLTEGQARTPRIEVIGGKLTRWFIITDHGQQNNPKVDYKREIIYRWSGDRFVIEEVKDTPPVTKFN